jgi:hypothetical protein
MKCPADRKFDIFKAHGASLGCVAGVAGVAGWPVWPVWPKHFSLFDSILHQLIWIREYQVMYGTSMQFHSRFDT